MLIKYSSAAFISIHHLPVCVFKFRPLRWEPSAHRLGSKNHRYQQRDIAGRIKAQNCIINSPVEQSTSDAAPLLDQPCRDSPCARWNLGCKTTRQQYGMINDQHTETNKSNSRKQHRWCNIIAYWLITWFAMGEREERDWHPSFPPQWKKKV